MATAYFSFQSLKSSNTNNNLFDKPGTLTALAALLTVVGIVFHVVLSSAWKPEGLQHFISINNHTLFPIATIIFWYLYEDKNKVVFKNLVLWLLYPVIYVGYVIIRGISSGFYPYPFLNVDTLGAQQVSINITVLLFVLMIFILIFKVLGNLILKIRKSAGNNA